MSDSFEEHRGLLLGIAYRMVGSMWDAEDIVQEAYVRWMSTDRSSVRHVRAFLVAVVTRLAVDLFRSARHRRESYPGPWLPEPVAVDDVGPADTAELRDSLSYATLHMMERLSPPERAVLVLREAFGLPYAEISDAVGISVEACRQHYSRARARLDRGRVRERPDAAGHRELIERFLVAADSGDLAGLTEVLAADVVAYNDGGGRVRAALRPIVGRAKVVGFVLGLLRRMRLDDYEWIEVNGGPALRLSMGSVVQVLVADVSGGRIQSLFAVMNPDKLRVIAGLVVVLGRFGSWVSSGGRSVVVWRPGVCVVAAVAVCGVPHILAAWQGRAQLWRVVGALVVGVRGG